MAVEAVDPDITIKTAKIAADAIVNAAKIAADAIFTTLSKQVSATRLQV